MKPEVKMLTATSGSIHELRLLPPCANVTGRCILSVTSADSKMTLVRLNEELQRPSGYCNRDAEPPGPCEHQVCCREVTVCCWPCDGKWRRRLMYTYLIGDTRKLQNKVGEERGRVGRQQKKQRINTIYSQVLDTSYKIILKTNQNHDFNAVTHPHRCISTIYNACRLNLIYNIFPNNF